jgi:hypothetical protein
MPFEKSDTVNPHVPGRFAGPKKKIITVRLTFSRVFELVPTANSTSISTKEELSSATLSTTLESAAPPFDRTSATLHNTCRYNMLIAFSTIYGNKTSA